MRDFFVYSSFSLDLDIFRTLKHSVIISIVMCTVTRNDVIRKIENLNVAQFEMLFAHVIPVCQSVYQKLIIKMLIHSWNSNLDVCRVFHTCKATDTF